MSELVWDAAGKKLFETGVNKGVLYPMATGGAYPLGVAWNGLTSVSESPSGAEANPVYANNVKYLNLISAEEFGASIGAYTYPDEFAICDGSANIAPGISIGQQPRKSFGMAYCTAIGNDEDGIDHGRKIHLIYGAMAAPSEKGYSTISESPEAIEMSWELTTTPVIVPGFKPTASLVIDSTKTDPAKLAALELILYGTAGVDPRLPLPDEIASIVNGAAPSALAMSTIVPADAATAIAVGASIVITFNNKILKEAVTLMSAAGAVIPVTKTWNADGKILTVKPVSNLSAATVYLTALIGVSDIYGQTLANVAKKFTTA